MAWLQEDVKTMDIAAQLGHATCQAIYCCPEDSAEYAVVASQKEEHQQKKEGDCQMRI